MSRSKQAGEDNEQDYLLLVKISKYRTFGDLILKSVALVKFLNPKYLTEKVWGFWHWMDIDFALNLDLMQMLILYPYTFLE